MGARAASYRPFLADFICKSCDYRIQYRHRISRNDESGCWAKKSSKAATKERFLVNRGNTVKGLSETRVIIKILGSAFSPLIFHAKTDDDGTATIHLQLPQFKSGHAAILIKAMSEGEETDLRRAITRD
jgi:hypothetical protein